MRLVLWNVNGTHVCIQRGFMDFSKEIDVDVFCTQETRIQPEQLGVETPGYHQYMSSAERKGYSGTMTFSKQKPLSVTYGLGIEEHDHEGRIITCEYEDSYLVCIYTPNSKDGLLRSDYRMAWGDVLRAYLHKLNETKSVLVCDDLSVVHKGTDLENPRTSRRNAGLTDEERSKISILLENGFTDSPRRLYPEQEGIYPRWSYRFKAHEKNTRWWIDCSLTLEDAKEVIRGIRIHTDIYSNDHCPVSLEFDKKVIQDSLLHSLLKRRLQTTGYTLAATPFSHICGLYFYLDQDVPEFVGLAEYFCSCETRKTML